MATKPSPKEMAAKLLPKHTIHIFFSSPFRGMEKERVLLTKKYWPQLTSLCIANGYEFVPIDLRWGITHESSQAANTLLMCLHEVSRSQLFIGFFGQRYGWHGENDVVLQKTISRALYKYPWLRNCRDKSITEIEVMTGFLNDVETRPASFFFRAKEYDDEMKRQCLAKGLASEAVKFDSSSDGDDSAEKLKVLKDKLASTKEKCVSFVPVYKDPEEGAILMYNSIVKYLEANYFKRSVQQLTKEESLIRQHQAYLVTHLNMGGQYLGMDDVSNSLQDHLDNGKHVVITGKAGSGKTALLSNWITKQLADRATDVFYHFVGCSSESGLPKNIIRRLHGKLDQIVEGLKEDDKLEGHDHTVDEAGRRNVPSIGRMKDANQMNDIQVKLNIISRSSRKLYIVVDDINRIKESRFSDKLTNRLFWLPKLVPKNVSIILSTIDSDNIVQTLDERDFVALQTKSANDETRRELLRLTLKDKGKELTAEEIDEICNNPNTSNFLFLDVLIESLCAHGNFETLNRKLRELSACKDTVELFTFQIKALETDFQDEEGMHADVLPKLLTSLCLTKDGMTEQEILNMLGIPSRLWILIYYSIFPFLLDQNGVISILHEPFREAIANNYLRNENESHYRTEISQFFLANFKGINPRMGGNDVRNRLIHELPGMLLKAGERDELASVLSNLKFFNQADLLGYSYDIWELWNEANFTVDEIAEFYNKAVDVEMTDQYIECSNSVIQKKHPGPMFARVLKRIANFLDDFSQPRASLKLSARAIKVQENYLAKYRKVLSETELMWEEILLGDLLMKKADSLCDIELYEESEMFHLKTLKIKLKYKDKKYGVRDIDSFIGTSYNGLGLINLANRKFDKAEHYFLLAIDHHEKSGVLDLKASSIMNLGNVYYHLKRFQSALDKYQDSMSWYEKIHFGQQHPIISALQANIANCKNRLGDKDGARELYNAALKVELSLFGELHNSTAITLMSIGGLELSEKNYKEAEDMYNRAFRIHLTLVGPKHMDTLRAQENVAAVQMMDKKNDEALENLHQAGDILDETGRMHFSSINLNKKMLKWVCHNAELRVDEQKTWLGHGGRIAKRMINGGFGEGLHYVFLDSIHRKFNESTPLDERYTIDAGLTRLPNDLTLLEAKLDSYLNGVSTVESVKTALDAATELRSPSLDAHINDFVNKKQIDKATFLRRYQLTRWPIPSDHRL